MASKYWRCANASRPASRRACPKSAVCASAATPWSKRPAEKTARPMRIGNSASFRGAAGPLYKNHALTFTTAEMEFRRSSRRGSAAHSCGRAQRSTVALRSLRHRPDLGALLARLPLAKAVLFRRRGHEGRRFPRPWLREPRADRPEAPTFGSGPVYRHPRPSPLRSAPGERAASPPQRLRPWGRASG